MIRSRKFSIFILFVLLISFFSSSANIIATGHISRLGLIALICLSVSILLALIAQVCYRKERLDQTDIAKT